MGSKNKGCSRIVFLALATVTVLCLFLVSYSLIVNSIQSPDSSQMGILTETEKARIGEVFHLRKELGDKVLPGWAQADIPVIAYNDQYLFLVGSASPQTGWKKIPQGTQMGKNWEQVPGDNFYGKSYFRQELPAPGVTTENFTVKVGEQWVASLMTLGWMKESLATEFRGDVPVPVQPLVPYPVIVRLFIPNSDTYITGVLHEAIHAYQGIRAPERLSAAEESARANSQQYPWGSQSFKDDWQVELDLLKEAMRASNNEVSRRLAREFLANRSKRREAARLSPALINLEQQKEWEEGIAKYGERMIHILPSQSEDYQPVPEVKDDPEFQFYQGAQQKWDQEVDQISRMAGDEGDGRFYYSGFAQAVLLDRLSPGWKERLFDDGVWLEDLLDETVNNQ